MGRWTQYDEDEYRLPAGMERVGYDSDTGRYLFRDSHGAMWQGAQGAEFSEMTRVSDGTQSTSSGIQELEEDVEASAPSRADGYQPLARDMNAPPHKRFVNTDAYRTLFPFFLIIAVVLLLIWRLILHPGLGLSPYVCPTNSTVYLVEPGDSCWEISQAHGCSFEKLTKLNQGVNCEMLMPGTTLCIPEAEHTVE